MERSGTTPQVAVAAPDLAEVLLAPGPFSTVYLTTEADIENAAQRSEQRWKPLRRELAEAGVAENVLMGVDALVGDAHLRGAGLVVVADGERLLHIEHTERAPARDLAIRGALPPLIPLVEARQSSLPHVLVLADRAGADLVAIRAQAPDLHREAGGGADPLARTQPGGWSQRRYQERAENTWEHNADDVAKELVRLVEQVGARLVVLAGDVRAVQLLRDALPRDVLDLVEEIEGGRSEDGSEQGVDARVGQVLAGAVGRETAGLLEKFREELGQGDRAVEGAAATIQALAQAQVDVLLVHDDPDDDRRAWFGPDATQVALSPGDVRALGADDPAEARLVDVAVRAALNTAAGVRVVPAHGGPREGIGAVLRWSA